MSAATINDGLVVLMHYTLKNDAGETLDSSIGSDPLPYLHGAGNIVDGLESALTNAAVGQKLDVVVEPEHGYGARDPEAVIQAPKDSFPPEAKIAAGDQFMMQTENGQDVPVWVTEVAGDLITLDANHPLAGERLHFSVEVAGIRDATDDERAHGHPHGLTGAEGHGH
jgi:FKBP-type peptidyl-prolyl cis-trans isomerase SlyD